jgi:DNA-binding transcriptional LysR family regulator
MFMTCLDLDGLRTFVAVVEAASFSRAADAIGRSQSAVSLQLARLERMLGKTLILRRQGRVLGITDDGRELLPYARRMVDLNDAAYRAVAQPAVTGRVRLGVPADFMDAAFPEVLRAFQHAQGGVELEVVSDVSERLRERVRQGLLDVAFFRRSFGENEGTVVARQRLAWVGGASCVIPAADNPLPLILFPEGCVFRAQALSALEASGRLWRLAYVCPSFQSVHAAIRSGLGIGALPAGVAIRDLIDLDGEGLPPLGDVELVMLIGREHGRASRFLADRILRHLHECWT